MLILDNLPYRGAIEMLFPLWYYINTFSLNSAGIVLIASKLNPKEIVLIASKLNLKKIVLIAGKLSPARTVYASPGRESRVLIARGLNPERMV